MNYSSITLTREIDDTPDGWKNQESKREYTALEYMLDSLDGIPRTFAQFKKICSEYGRIMLSWNFRAFSGDTSFTDLNYPESKEWYRVIVRINYTEHMLETEYRVGIGSDSRESNAEEFRSLVLSWFTRSALRIENDRQLRDAEFDRKANHE
jgi:hypothetical protein